MSGKACAARRTAARVALASSLLGVPFSFAGADDPPDPSDILRQSYSLGKQFVPSERAFHLFVLTDVACRLNLSPCANWARELFTSTVALPSTWNRGALQKNALASLSRADAQEALALLSKVDPPVPARAGDVIQEDLRADAARTVFDAYWKAASARGIPRIREEARRIGDGGLYPFGAIGPVYKAYAETTSPAMVVPWFREVANYYRRGSVVASVHSEYVEFLLTTWPVLADSQRAEGLRLAVTRLAGRPNHEPNTSYSASIQDGPRTIEARSASQRLLQSLLPRVRELDPAWAASLAAENSLATDGDSSLIAEVRVRGPIRLDTHAQELHQRALESQQIPHVQTAASTNVDEALRLASTLSEPDLHAEALALIAATVAQHDPDQARRLVGMARTDLPRIADPHDVLTALVAIAEACSRMRDMDAVADLTSQALTLGEEIYGQFVQTAPMTPLFNAPFFQDAARLSRFALRERVPGFLAQVQGIRQPTLRAYLLPYCAEGIQERPNEAASERAGTGGDPYVIGVSLRWRPGCAHIVWGVTKQSPAAEAGIAAGDRLVEVAGRSLVDVDGEEAAALIKSSSPGSVALVLARKNAKYSVTVQRERSSTVLSRGGWKLAHGAVVPLDATAREVDRMLTFDRSRLVAAVFPLHYPSQPELYFGGFEALVLQDPDEVLIGGIEDGPAQDAGLRWGDGILSIDGSDPRGRSAAELERLFSSAAQKSLSLTVERNGRVQVVTLALERSASVMARNGVRLENGQVVPAGITAEDAECLATQSGGSN